MTASLPLFPPLEPALPFSSRGAESAGSSGDRRRILDLFCGAGGAAMGYHRAGFEVVGVDIDPQPNYPFEFVQMEAMRVLEHLERHWAGQDEAHALGYRFDAIHASPPCQLFSSYQRANKHQRPDHVNLIPQTRELLQATGLPYIIENVPAAREHLHDPAEICGVSVGLHVKRHRLFESNVPLITPPCACGGWMKAQFNRGSRHIRPNDRRTVAVGEWRIPLDIQQWAMGIDWMTVAELSQAIPPAYTELLGHQLLSHVSYQRGAAPAAHEA